MENTENFKVNINKVIDSDQFYLAKELAKLIKDKGYINIGNYMRSLSKADLDILADKIMIAYSVESVSPEYRATRASELMLMTGLLAFGEGEPILNKDKMFTYCNKFHRLVCVTALDRAGNLSAKYENFNVSDESEDFYEGLQK